MIDAADRDAFVTRYGALFEHSPWVVARVWARRPFADAQALHASCMAVLAEASPEDRLRLIRAHPELADKVARDAGLTEASAAEQESAGLDRLSAADFARFHALNAAYRDRFGFPFIICVRLHDTRQILDAMQARLAHELEHELPEAIAQIGDITRLRLAAIEPV